MYVDTSEAAQRACLLSSEGTLGIVPPVNPVVWHRGHKKINVCKFQDRLMIHFDSFGFVELCFLLCL